MSNNNELPDEEKFSDDPEENLRLQNDFLKMKMMAENGAIFGGEGNLPSDIENEFLKNIMAFEKQNDNAKPVQIVEILGNPVFEDEENLDDEKFETEFKRLNDLLNEFSFEVDFAAPRSDRFKYNFITKELFEHESLFIPVKGMTSYYSYEEFHPDHKLEITNITNHFLNDFIERKLSVDTWYINNEIIDPEGKIQTREEIMSHFQAMYDATLEFENFSFQTENTNFELRETDGEEHGMGFSEGIIQYDIIFQGGERKEIKGPFKIYFGMQGNGWTIYFFYLAGFNLHQQG